MYCTGDGDAREKASSGSGSGSDGGGGVRVHQLTEDEVAECGDGGVCPCSVPLDGKCRGQVLKLQWEWAEERAGEEGWGEGGEVANASQRAED